MTSSANPKNWNQKYNPGEDKVKHGFAGFAITVAVWMFLTEVFGVSKAKVFAVCAIIGGLVAVGALYGKEAFWDGYLGLGMPDIWDYWCGVIGIPIAFVVIGIYGYIQIQKGGLK